jgi:hypothetical protein
MREIETLWQIVRMVAEQDGRGDYLEMGDQCIYCSWIGNSNEPIIHDEDCIVAKAHALVEDRKTQQYKDSE